MLNKFQDLKFNLHFQNYDRSFYLTDPLDFQEIDSILSFFSDENLVKESNEDIEDELRNLYKKFLLGIFDGCNNLLSAILYFYQLSDTEGLTDDEVRIKETMEYYQNEIKNILNELKYIKNETKYTGYRFKTALTMSYPYVKNLKTFLTDIFFVIDEKQNLVAMDKFANEQERIIVQELNNFCMIGLKESNKMLNFLEELAN